VNAAPTPSTDVRLTPRQAEALGYHLAGLSTGEIARAMGISSRRARAHVAEALKRAPVSPSVASGDDADLAQSSRQEPTRRATPPQGRDPTTGTYNGRQPPPEPVERLVTGDNGLTYRLLPDGRAQVRTSHHEIHADRSPEAAAAWQRWHAEREARRAAASVKVTWHEQYNPDLEEHRQLMEADRWVSVHTVEIPL
jgi:hypothetical protein